MIGADFFDCGSESRGRIRLGNLKKARGRIATSKIKLVGREFKLLVYATVLESDRCGKEWGELISFTGNRIRRRGVPIGGRSVGQASRLPWNCFHHRRDACATLGYGVGSGFDFKNHRDHCGKNQESEEPVFFHFSWWSRDRDFFDRIYRISKEGDNSNYNLWIK